MTAVIELIAASVLEYSASEENNLPAIDESDRTFEFSEDAIQPLPQTAEYRAPAAPAVELKIDRVAIAALPAAGNAPTAEAEVTINPDQPEENRSDEFYFASEYDGPKYQPEPYIDPRPSLTPEELAANLEWASEFVAMLESAGYRVFVHFEATSTGEGYVHHINFIPPQMILE